MPSGAISFIWLSGPPPQALDLAEQQGPSAEEAGEVIGGDGGDAAGGRAPHPELHLLLANRAAVLNALRRFDAALADGRRAMALAGAPPPRGGGLVPAPSLSTNTFLSVVPSPAGFRHPRHFLNLF